MVQPDYNGNFCYDPQNEAEETYPTLEGAADDKGVEYEKLSTLFYSLELAFTKTFKNFKISTNNGNYPSFDDVILDLTKADNTEETYAIQLKHGQTEASSTFTEGDLASKKKNQFCFRKYFNSFMKFGRHRSNLKLVVYTNKEFQPMYKEENGEIELKFFDPTCPSDATVPRKPYIIKIVRHDKCILNEILNTSTKQDGFIYKLKIEEDDDHNEVQKTRLQLTEEEHGDYQQFFKNFYYYTSQSNVEGFKELILEKQKAKFELKNEDDVQNFQNYHQYIKDWCSGDEQVKVKLSKYVVETKIIDTILAPYVKLAASLSFEDKVRICVMSTGSDSDSPDQKFNESKSSCLTQGTVDELWKNLQLDDKIRLVKEAILSFNVSIVDEVNDNIYKIWGEESAVSTMVQLAASKMDLIKSVMKLRQTRFILTGENIKYGHADASSDAVFRTLADVEKVNPEVFSYILDMFRCDFQGRKSVTLREITNGNNNILSAIHLRHILQMLFNPHFSIGDQATDIPNPPYINRRIPKLIINVNSLQRSESDIFVISRNGRVTNYNKLPNNVMILEQTTQQKFDEICAKHRSQNVHRLDLIEDGSLEWISTTHRKPGTAVELEENTKYFVEDSEVLAHFQNTVNVLIADSGMGKTTMFHFFKRHAPTNFWPIRIDLMMSSEFFNKERKPHDILHDIMGIAPDEIASYMRTVYKQNKKILILLDGIDCLKTGNISSVIAGVKVLAQLKCPIWIAAKPHLKNKLEKEFGVVSLTLTSAGQYNQEQYIKQRLKHHYSDEKIEEIIDMRKQSKGLRDMFEVPITLFMFTDVWLRCAEAPKQTFTVTDLYLSFTDARLDFYFGKTDIGGAHLLTSKIMEFTREFYKELYVKAALKTCFDIDSEENNYLMLLKKIREEGDDIGFITNVNENKVPVFSHQTYAEFLAALHLVKNWTKNEAILHELFKEKHSNVRYMFDMLMAEECPAHLAVLEQNLDKLKDVQESILDKGGRNALHLACSWGVRHPLLNTVGKERIFNSRANTYDKFVSIPDEEPVYIEIIKLLVASDVSIIWECDRIFKWNVMDYADYSLSLAAIDTLAGFAEITEMDLLNLSNFKDLNSVLSYAIKFDYKNLWRLIEPKPFFCIEPYLIHTPLSLIIHYNRIDFLVEVMENPEFLTHVDDIFHDRSLLQYALKNGHVEVAQILIDSNADINAEYLGEYPLLICVKKHYVDLAKYLITHCKVDLDVVDRAGRNMLYLAAFEGLIEVLQIVKKAWLESNVNTTKELLYTIIRERRFHVLLFLIEYGLDITKLDEKGRNALNLAVKFQDRDLLNNENSILRYIISTEKFNIDAPEETSYGSTPLEVAIMKGDVNIIEFLVEKGCDTLTKGKDYLQLALNHKNYEAAEYLITSRKFGINLSEETKNTHLDCAVKRRDRNAVRLLLKHKADASNLKKIRKIAFQLVKSIWGRSRLALYYLLENYDQDMIYAKDEMQNTLLHYCVKNGARETAEFLIDRKAPVTVVNNDGENLIHSAADSNRITMVKIVLEQPALIQKINDKNKSGNSALHVAINKGNLELIQLLLANGADINILDGGGRNVLHQAVRKKHAEVFDFLVNKVDFSLEDTDNSGNTVLFYAVTNEAFHIAQQLVKKGARIDVMNKMEMNLLHAAADGTSLFTVKYLVETLKFNPNKADKVGKRPIDRCYDVEIFKFLLRNTDTDIGYLFRNAVQRMYRNIIEYLASQGETRRHIDDVDEHGNSALHLLMFQRASDKTKKEMKTGLKYFKSKFSHCLKCLIEGGADVNLQNNSGDTPLSLAFEGKHEVALSIFAQYGYGIADFPCRLPV